MNMNKHISTPHQNIKPSPKLGIQGTVIGWLDPWAGAASDKFMRTGTGAILPAQDPPPSPQQFLSLLQELKAEFYVHQLFPGLEGQKLLLEDIEQSGIDLCLGNEYGNINGPWTAGANRYDVPDEHVLEAAATGRLIGLLYDEPEHLQINAAQYRKDGWFPHWGNTDAKTVEQQRSQVTDAVSRQVQHVQHLLETTTLEPVTVPLVAEHVFPMMLHAHARGGMALCPKIMKESFQSLQLATALGAAKQYKRPLWICADLWGPDVGGWPIRTPGFPGHSPEEFASALRLGYYMAPERLFAENIDALAVFSEQGFRTTAFGEVWQQFVGEFVPQHPLTWSHSDASPDIAIIYADDSNYGQNERPFGNRSLVMPDASQSLFHIWHLISHGTIPQHGSCMHIPGYNFPRHELKRLIPDTDFPLFHGVKLPHNPPMHPLFYPVNNVLVFDGFVREQELGQPQLIFIAGSSVSADTLLTARTRAEQGAVVIAASWLLPKEWRTRRRFENGGLWLPVETFLSEEVRSAAASHIGTSDCWLQRFGETEVRIHRGDKGGFTLDFEIHNLG